MGNTTMIDMKEYQQRRQKFMAAMLPNSIAIIPGAKEYMRNWDNPFPYRQNNDFYYLTGFNEPESVAVLFDNTYWLFNRPRDPAMEIWNGRRQGQAGAEQNYLADKAFDIQLLKEKLPELLKDREVLYFPFGRQMEWDRVIQQSINTLRVKVRAGIAVPEMIVNPEKILHEMRLHKSPAEINVMKKAAEISINAHLCAMKRCQPGMYEYELQAAMYEIFIQSGSLSPAYQPIIGSGENSCILHYNENNKKIENGDIVLIDSGCEYQNYASDITRSFPANGKFSPEQKAVYNVCLAAQTEAMKLVKPGLPWPSLQETVIKTITEGLVDIGLLKGSVQDLIDQKAYFKFYMHGAGHFLGLDTHDVGNYKPNKQWRPLESGMAFTIEPGIYIAKDDAVDERFWNIGIRIEDNILVTETGFENLTERLPKTVDEIESLMQGK